MPLKTVFKAIRPSFLVLSPVCVFLGLSTSLVNESPINVYLFLIILLGAIAAHISVNTLNEYYDFKSGLDLKTKRTAFSGGSGALPDNPQLARLILAIGLLTLMITIIIGFYITFSQGIQILPVGIAGVLIIITYTQWLNRFPFICLIAPGLGFGVLMVVGTHMILTDETLQLPWLVSLVPFFLINNLLLLNQYPDIQADKSVGRNTFPIAYGIQKSNLVYALFIVAAYSLISIGIAEAYIPTLSLIALIPVIFSLYALYGANKYGFNIADKPKYLGANVAASILTPLLLGITISIG